SHFHFPLLLFDHLSLIYHPSFLFPFNKCPYGKTGIKSIPVFSSIPSILFIFCTACPEAPFTKLSMTETTVTRFVRSSYVKPISQKFEPYTSFVLGNVPASRIRTK